MSTDSYEAEADACEGELPHAQRRPKGPHAPRPEPWI